MYLGDTLHYLAIGNPVSQALLTAGTAVAKTTSALGQKLPVARAAAAPQAADMYYAPLHDLIGRNYNFVRLAGLSGASAIIINAYMNKVLAEMEDVKEQQKAKSIYKTAYHFHFVHTVGLLAVPLSRNPALTGSLMSLGTALFSGTLYYHAATGDNTYVNVAVCGGFCLIVSWLTLIFEF